MRFVIALLSFISSSTIIGFLFCFFSLDSSYAVISILFGLAVSVYILKKYKNISSGIKIKNLSLWSWLMIFIFTLFTFKSFLWLIFQKGNEWHISSPNNLGDLSLHIAHIHYFVNGIKFWPDSPIITNHKLQYPIGIDLFNSLLILSGMDLIKSLVWVGLLCSFATMIAFLMWGGPFALAGFLFNGGLAGLQFFQAFKFADYQSEIAWKNIALTMFITQRGLLFAIPAGIILLCSSRERFFPSGDKKTEGHKLPLWIEVLLYASMPLFHLHTFVFFTLFLILLGLLAKGEIKNEIIKLFKFSFVPATIFILFLTNFFSASSVINFKPGWMQSDFKMNFLYFWIYNFGLSLPLAMWLFVSLTSTKKNNITYFNFSINKNTAFVIPASILFVLFCVVMLAPWDWDNMKLLIWSYFIFLPFVFSEIISKQQKNIQVLICLILFFSGFICTIGGIDPRKSYALVKFNELRRIENGIKHLNINYRFACHPTFNQPVLLSGHKVTLGYPGWIWSHGIKMNDVDKKIEKLMLGSSNWKKIAKELNVNYIFWGELEKKNYSSSLRPWENDGKLVATGSWGKVYEINTH